MDKSVCRDKRTGPVQPYCFSPLSAACHEGGEAIAMILLREGAASLTEMNQYHQR